MLAQVWQLSLQVKKAVEYNVELSEHNMETFCNVSDLQKFSGYNKKSWYVFLRKVDKIFSTCVCTKSIIC